MRNSHSGTLFHYTRTLESLSSILREGLRASYSKERISDKIFIAIPMISFCDIPFECCEEHREKYGRYAVGLNKNWMIDTYGDLLSPVHYVLRDEPIRGAWRHHENYLKANETVRTYEARKKAAGEEKIRVPWTLGIVCEGYAGKLNDKVDCKVLLAMNDLFHAHEYANYSLGITKNYKCSHNGKDFCAYDECEWRILIPEHKEANGNTSKWFWTESDYNAWRSDRENGFLDGFTFPIETESIDYIVIQSEKERPMITSVLEENGSLILADKIKVLDV